MAQLAAAYIRVSTEDQTEYSPAAQLTALQRYADDNGYILDPAHIYRDEGISGRSASKRPGFQQMIAAAKRKDHPFDVILVHKLDRFARSREDSVVYKSMLLRECGVRVISITEPLSDDKTSILIEPLLEAMAEYYSVNLGEEVKKGMTQKAKQGGLQSTPPFGYTVQNHTLVPDPETADYVRQIFRRYVDGEAVFAIARWLNGLGVRTRRGNPIENRTVEYILRNPVYVGFLRWNPSGKTRREFNNPNIITAKGAHEPLIDQALFDAAQARLDEQKRTHPYKGKPVGMKRKHWLCGIVRCANCGGTLILSGAQYGSYFRCSYAVRGSCNTTQHISAERLEAAVLQQLEADAEDGSALRFQQAQRRAAAARDDTQRSIAALRRRVDRLRDAYLAGVETLEDYSRGKAALETQIAALEAEQAEAASADPEDLSAGLRQDIRRVLATLRDDSVSTEAKHTAAAGLLQSVIFDRGNNLLRVYYHAAQ